MKMVLSRAVLASTFSALLLCTNIVLAQSYQCDVIGQSSHPDAFWALEPIIEITDEGELKPWGIWATLNPEVVTGQIIVGALMASTELNPQGVNWRGFTNVNIPPEADDYQYIFRRTFTPPPSTFIFMQCDMGWGEDYINICEPFVAGEVVNFELLFMTESMQRFTSQVVQCQRTS